MKFTWDVFFLAALGDLQNLSSLAVKAMSPNHWTIREFPGMLVNKTDARPPPLENLIE